MGDTNGDCACDVEDVQYLQYYRGGALTGVSLSAAQLKAMDPDLDGDTDGDIVGAVVGVSVGTDEKGDAVGVNFRS